MPAGQVTRLLSSGMEVAMRRPVIRLIALALIVAAPAAPARKIFKYTDENGVVHFTDVRPQDAKAVTEAVVQVERRDIAELRIDGGEEERDAHVFNALAGPVEVRLTLDDAENIVASPSLPLNVVLGPHEDRVVARLRRGDAHAPGGFRLALAAVPGDPGAHAEEAEYRLPLGGSYRLDQGFGGSFSHTDEQSLYAIDLAVAEGTPVLAAREGVVMQVEDDFYGAGLDKEKYATRANVVRVLHADGSMAVYAHLRPESVVVQPGRHVYVGQKLGESGNTGYSTGPHLHFCVQVNSGMKLVSIPFRLSGPDGPIAIPDARTAAGAAR